MPSIEFPKDFFAKYFPELSEEFSLSDNPNIARMLISILFLYISDENDLTASSSPTAKSYLDGRHFVAILDTLFEADAELVSSTNTYLFTKNFIESIKENPSKKKQTKV